MITASHLSSLKDLIRRSTPEWSKPIWARLTGSLVIKRYLKSAFWSVFGNFLSRGLVLASSIVAARIIGKAHYGELGIIQNTIGMFGLLAGLGMGLTATKYVAEFAQTNKERVGNIISLSSIISWCTSSVLAMCLFLSADWIANFTLKAPHLAGPLRLSSLMLLFYGINGAQTGVLAGFEKFKSIAIVNLLSGLIAFPLVMLGAWRAGVSGIIIGQVTAQGVGCLLNFKYVRKECTKRNVLLDYRRSFVELPIIWRFSLPAVLSGLVVSPVTWACSTMLVRQPGGYNEMGLFSAANQWFSALIWIPSMLGQAILPLLSERLGSENGKDSLKLMKFAIRANFIATIPIVLMGILFSSQIMGTYGTEFLNGGGTLVVVLLTSGLLAMQTPVGQIIAASGKMWLGFRMNLVWAFIFLAATWALLPLGGFGLASARFIAYIGHSFWTFYYAYTRFQQIK